MLELSIWLHYFLWMIMMVANILQNAIAYFPTIMTAIFKNGQKIQNLSETAEECFKESPEKDIPKKHSKEKSKERKMEDSKCLDNVVIYNERESQEEICSKKEVPSNVLSDANSIVHKIRPPERVKKRTSLNKVATISTAVIFLGHFCGTNAESSNFTSLEFKVGQNVSMEIPEYISENVPFFIQYTSNNNSSEVLTLCIYVGGVLSTPNPNESYHQGITCLPKSVFISSAKYHHAGTYSIILGCDEPNCPLKLIFNLTITEKGEPLAHPVLHTTMETVENGTNKTDFGGGSDKTKIILVVVIISSALVTVVILVIIVILAVKYPQLYKRILNLFPWKKNSNPLGTTDSAQDRMMTDPERESDM